jgi:hypothetical protein
MSPLSAAREIELLHFRRVRGGCEIELSLDTVPRLLPLTIMYSLVTV